MGWIGRKEISLVSYDVVLVTEVGNKGAELLEDPLEAVTDLVVCACLLNSVQLNIWSPYGSSCWPHMYFLYVVM